MSKLISVGHLWVSASQVFPIANPVGNTRALARVVVSDQLQLTGIAIKQSMCGELRVVYPSIGTEAVLSVLPGAFKNILESRLLHPDTAGTEFEWGKYMLEITGMVVRALPERIGKTVAFVSCTLGSDIVLRGMRVVDGVNGLFLSYPNDPGYRGEDYRSLYYPVTRELRDALETRALEMYSGEYTGEGSYNSN